MRELNNRYSTLLAQDHKASNRQNRDVSQGSLIPTVTDVPGPGDMLYGTRTYHSNCVLGRILSKESSWQCRRHESLRFDPWVGRIPWRKKCNALQCSCLENLMDRGAWRAAVPEIAELDMA